MRLEYGYDSQVLSSCYGALRVAFFYMEHNMEQKLKKEALEEMKIKKVKKGFKTHRSAIDFDKV